MNEILGFALLGGGSTILKLVVVAFAIVIAVAMVFALATGRSVWRWALLGFLAVYLPIFWDHIPTVLVHKHYCETESGFWIYKSLDQWKKENPGVAETLVANKGAPSKRQGDMVNYTDTYYLNQRFNWVVKHNGQFLFNRWRHEQEIVDAKTNEVLARYVDFSTSQEQRKAGWSGWKFWLVNEHCSGGAMNGGRLSTLMETVTEFRRKGELK